MKLERACVNVVRFLRQGRNGSISRHDGGFVGVDDDIESTRWSSVLSMTAWLLHSGGSAARRGR